MPTHSSGFHPQYWEVKKKKRYDKIAATYLGKNTTLFGSPGGRGLLLQGTVRGQKAGVRSLDSFAELPRTKCLRQPALGVRFEKTPVALCSSLVLLARGTHSRRPCQPYSRRDLQRRSQDSRQERTKAAALLSGPRKTGLA